MNILPMVIGAAPGSGLAPFVLLLSGAGVILALVWMVLWFMVPFYIRDIKRATEAGTAHLALLVEVERAHEQGRAFFAPAPIPQAEIVK